jgi:hypothetical protein
MSYWIIRFINNLGYEMWFVEYDTRTGACALIADKRMARKFMTEGSANRLLQKLNTEYPGQYDQYQISVESVTLQ